MKMVGGGDGGQEEGGEPKGHRRGRPMQQEYAEIRG